MYLLGMATVGVTFAELECEILPWCVMATISQGSHCVILL